MGFQITKSDIEAVINCVPESIERVLQVIKLKLEKYVDKQGSSQDDQPQSNPYYNQKPINQNQMYNPNIINQQQQQQQEYCFNLINLSLAIKSQEI